MGESRDEGHEVAVAGPKELDGGEGEVRDDGELDLGGNGQKIGAIRYRETI